MTKKTEIVVPKSVQRAELAADVAKFLASGGSIEVVTNRRKPPKSVCRGKSTRSVNRNGSLGYSAVRMGV